MQLLTDSEIGVMFWGGPDPVGILGEVKALGVRCGQIGIAGDLPLAGLGAKWKTAIEAENFTITTAFAAYNGESYADIPTVQRTVGFIPPETRAERERRTYEVSDFACDVGIPSIATHIGFVPEDDTDPEYMAVRGMVRRVCDHARKNRQTFALETGQESADTLLRFLIDVNRPNLGINFDPANMILYGTGDPVAALGTLASHVISVHCKDGDWPPKGVPGALGEEKPLGQGAVGMERFVGKLKSIGFKGPLNIEREIPDHAQRLRDIGMGVKLLEKLRA
jgi:sugar phosphate isomerase/epimerase